MIKIPSGIIVHSSISHGKSSNDSRGNHGKIPAQIMEASSHGWLPEGKKKHVVHWKKNWNAAQRWKKYALLHHLIYIYVNCLCICIWTIIYIYIHMKCVYTYIHMKYGFVWKSSASSDPSQGFKPHMAPLWIHTHCPQLPQRVWPWLQVIAARYDKNQLGLEFFCCCSQWKIYL